MNIKPEQFEKYVMEALAEYGDEATEKLEAITKDVSRQTVRALKASAPSGGSYARGWTHKPQRGGAYVTTDTVYNRLYMLTHLLEKPHSTGRNKGGHYPKHKDYTGNIARVEAEYTEKYVNEVVAKL